MEKDLPKSEELLQTQEEVPETAPSESATLTEQAEEVPGNPEGVNFDQILEDLDSEPGTKLINLNLLRHFPCTEIDFEGQKLLKYVLQASPNPERKIANTSQIHYKLVMRDSTGELYRSSISEQVNQKRKLKLLSPKFKTQFYEYLKPVIFSMAEKEVCVVKIPPEVHRMTDSKGPEDQSEDRLGGKPVYYRVEIPLEKLTKGVAGVGGGQPPARNIHEEVDKYFKLKEEANQKFREKEYSDAAKAYNKIRKVICSFPGKGVNALNATQKAKLLKLKVDVINNLLRALFKNVKDGGLEAGLELIYELDKIKDLKKVLQVNVKYCNRVIDILVLAAKDDLVDAKLEQFRDEAKDLGLANENLEEFLKEMDKLEKKARKEISKLKRQENQRIINNFEDYSRKMEEMERKEKIRQRQLERQGNAQSNE